MILPSSLGATCPIPPEWGGGGGGGGVTPLARASDERGGRTERERHGRDPLPHRVAAPPICRPPLSSGGGVAGAGRYPCRVTHASPSSVVHNRGLEVAPPRRSPGPKEGRRVQPPTVGDAILFPSPPGLSGRRLDPSLPAPVLGAREAGPRTMNHAARSATS